MSSFEWNKIIGAVLGAMILAMVSGIIAGNLVKPKRLEHPAYAIAGAESSKSQEAAAGAAKNEPEPVEPLLATADVEAGKKIANQASKCAQCHSFDKGGSKKIGPNLYSVLGEPIAEGRDGFPFTPALRAHKGETWTVDALNKWLFNPRQFASGTGMAFAGLKSAQDRANVIAYLNTLSDAPKPLGK
jgi:cytochrome c